jgi:hypothetical protein
VRTVQRSGHVDLVQVFIECTLPSGAIFKEEMVIGPVRFQERGSNAPCNTRIVPF